MDIEEEISERIIRQAFEGGGEVIFTDTELKECTDRKLLQKVNFFYYFLLVFIKNFTHNIHIANSSLSKIHFLFPTFTHITIYTF